MSTSLFDRLGGAEAVENAVDIFYDRLMDDPDVSHFFLNSDMPNLRRKQVQFMSYAFGKPGAFSDANLARAHAKVVSAGMNDDHFDMVADHLRQTLIQLGVGAAEVAEVMGVLESVRDPVLGRAG